MDNPIQLLGLAAVAALAGYVLSLVAGQFLSSQRQARFSELELKLLQARVDHQLEEVRFGQNRRKSAWAGYRKFLVREKIQECDGVCSFVLTPHDGKPVQTFLPGQYLTFQLQIPGVSKPVVRCYSISDSPAATDCYRVSIKRIPPGADNAPPGLVSNYFHSLVKVGGVLDVKAPSGHFFLAPQHQGPVVLIAGGIGVTPLLSMLKSIVESGSNREVWFFCGVHNRYSHVQKEYLNQVAREHKNIHLHVCYSNVNESDVQGEDYHHAERVGVDLLKRLLPSSNYDFFICGPGAMMKQIFEELETWGVPPARIHYEAFGSATVQRVSHEKPEAVEGEQIEVTFSRAQKTCVWDPNSGSLLEFAEANGVMIDAGCRAGNCGTCATRLRSGKVTYLNQPGARTQDDYCLVCIAVPKTNVALNA